MKGTYLKHLLCTSAAGLFLSASAYAGTPLWTYSAPTPATASVAPGGTTTVKYTVTNQSAKSKKLILKATAGLSASPCNLVMRGSTCALTLTINGSTIPSSGILGGPVLCEQDNPNQCYQPSQPNILNVTVTNTPPVPPIKNAMAAMGFNDNGAALVVSGYYSLDNGKNWVLSSTQPPGEVKEENGGISCNTKGACTIVANTVVSGQKIPKSYFSTDMGTTWIVSATQPPAVGLTDNTLYGVACNVSGACAAVGKHESGALTAPLSYYSTDTGKTWKASSIMPTAIGTNVNQLTGVSCNSSGACAAVGYSDSFVQNLPLSYFSFDNGKIWIASLTLPPPQSALTNQLTSVSCNDNGACAAVGFYDNGVRQVPLSYFSTNGGISWTVSPTMPQAVVGSTNNKLNSVFCTASGACVAVGSYENPNSTPVSYYSSDAGKTWSISTLQPIGTDDGLSGVFCTASGACSAVGISNNTPSSYYSTDNGKTWTVSPTLPPVLGTFSSARSVS